MTESVPNPSRCVYGALALELAHGSSAGADALDQQAAGALARCIARDLAGFAAGASGLDLALVGAHYDPAELLRPGWPLHAAIERLAARAPGDSGGRVIAFGAHEGRLPEPLMPDDTAGTGPMRLLPFVLGGDPERVADTGAILERDLLEQGMAAADTALLAQQVFSLRVEHARYLTLHDLCAMTALQYEHAGLATLWPLLETALLSPDSEAWLDAPPEPLIRYVQGEARIALFTPDGWHAHYATGSDDDDARLERRYGYFQARQRQIAALLQAHAIPVTFAHCRSRHDPRAELG